jgi:hypothetical protein
MIANIPQLTNPNPIIVKTMGIIYLIIGICFFIFTLKKLFQYIKYRKESEYINSMYEARKAITELKNINAYLNRK